MTYTMALKHNLTAPPPTDWQTQLAAIPGVAIQGKTDRGAQFTASADAFARVQAAFSTYFLIEEVRDRSIL